MKKILIIFPYLLISILYTEDLDVLVEKATNYYFNEKYDLAYEYSIKALKIDSMHPYANFYIADYYGFQRDYKKALNHYNIAIENFTHKTFVLAHYQRAITKIVLNEDLDYCSDIKKVKKAITNDSSYQFLEDRNPRIFNICK